MGFRMKYGFSKTIGLSYQEALEKVTNALKREGFGVLTSIDVKDTMKKKLDIDFPKYAILGACNPPFAYKALQADEEIGLLLPCNVIVYEKAGKTVVSAFDPMIMTKIVDNDQLRSVANEVGQRLHRVIDSL
jgi:uncharacterized protein (DUF302 family)